jgi:two-component sensor histidine kinase
VRRWRRARRAGNVQGIRFRLATAFAIALAPILLLSAVQSRAAFLAEERRVEADLVRAASDSAATAQARVDAAVIMLETLRPESVGLYCVPRLRELAERQEGYEALVRVSASGRIVCASHTVSGQDLASQPWFARLRQGEPVVLAATPSRLLTERPAVLAAVRSESPLGRFDGAFIAVIAVEDLQPSEGQGASERDLDVALVDAMGRVLTATDASAFPANGIAPRDLGRELTTVTAADGERRVLSGSPFAGRDIFVAASTPSQGLFAWAMGNALAVFILPLLTWVVALVCALVLTERFVIRWLAYLERVAAIHAKGRHSVRPVLAQRAPAEIRTLASAMDRMVLAIEARDASLRESLEEKDALMREIHHRVKNNLQVITSLLNMQQRALTDPGARAAMKDTRQRITALALIYRALYQSETLKQVDVGRFLQDLTSQLIASESGHGPVIDTHVAADVLLVDPDKLAPMALWAVEAISNAQKHAFEGRGGRLDVRFKAGPETSSLEVEDDGPGVSDEAAAQGLGRTSMTAFARQLRGDTEVTRSESGGVRVRLTFPTPEVALAGLTDSAGRRNQVTA